MPDKLEPERAGSMQTNEKGDQEQGGSSVVPAEDKFSVEQQQTPYLEIVWSSPAFTTPTEPRPGDAAPKTPRAVTRYVHAFESDFLDSHVTWDEDPTPEPAPKKRSRNRAASRTSSSNVRLIDIYPGDIAAKPPPPQQGELAFPSGEIAATPPPPPVSTFETHRFTPSVEQPMVDGRPTGMVFFETMAQRPAVPTRVVYSTNEPILEPAPEPIAEEASAEPPRLDQPNEAAPDSLLSLDANIPTPAPAAPIAPPPDLQAIINRARPEVAAVESAVKAFFDFPDHVPHVPSEDTDHQFDHHPPAQRTFGTRFLGALSWCVLVGFFVTVAVVLLYGRYAHKRLYQADSGGGRVVDVVVQPGESFRSVVDKLKKQGLLGSFMGVSDYYLMRYLAHLNENSNKIKPGVYRISSGASLNDIYTKLIEGSKDFKITVPEGKTAREVASDVKKHYPEFDDVRFLELIRDQAFIKKLEVDAPSLEGYLYPSTYFFGPGMREEDLVKLMVNTFKQNVDSQVKPLPRHDELSFQQHLVMASLIEREARLDEDRPLIASVIFNRLAKDMPLQIDASVNFALNDWRKLSLEDLKVDSPYNTYTHKGLPPGPIASPRIASLVATFTAPQTKYLFYVYQGDGRHAFSETYEDFLANKHKFEKGVAELSNFNQAPAGQTTSTAAAPASTKSAGKSANTGTARRGKKT